MQLRSKDLRVGNYVNYNNTVHIVNEIQKNTIKISWIDSKNIKEDEFDCLYKNILSLPLTNKEIEKFGYIKDDNNLIENRDLYINNSDYIIENNNGTIWLCNQFGRIAIIEYVHELQNLYFSLKNEELKY